MVVDWQCIRYAQKELCIKKNIRLDQFKERWILFFGKPTSDSEKNFFLPGGGIEMFYEDYMTDRDSSNLDEYLGSIRDGKGLRNG